MQMNHKMGKKFKEFQEKRYEESEEILQDLDELKQLMNTKLNKIEEEIATEKAYEQSKQEVAKHFEGQLQGLLLRVRNTQSTNNDLPSNKRKFNQ